MTTSPTCRTTSTPTRPPEPGPFGLACPAHGLPLGADVDNAVLRHLAAEGGEIADLIWEAPDELAAEHAQVFLAAMRAHNAGDAEHGDRLWENLRAIWSQAWSANYAVLEFMQATGLTRFSPVKPQHWVIASFEHHTSPHGLPLAVALRWVHIRLTKPLPRPHIHNIVLPSMTTAA
jgi:hypothetical protein